MKILSIETSCDETAISLVSVTKNKGGSQFHILSNQTASQIALHTQYGGVFPMMAKREHQKNIIPVFQKVLRQAKMYELKKKIIIDEKLDKKIAEILVREPELLNQWNKLLPRLEKLKIDVIAVTTGPGLEPALWVGINFARALGTYWDIPVVPVNHMEGHIFSIFPNKSKKFTVDINKKLFPMLSLLVSGGHTELVLAKDWMKYKQVGQTRDDAAGEAFDKVARMLGLPYPGGPEISRLAAEERKQNVSRSLAQADGPSRAKIQQNFMRANKNILRSDLNKIILPRPMIHSKDYDFSFSGLKTAVLYAIRDLPGGTLSDSVKSHIAREFEDAVVEVLVSKTLRATKEYKIKTLIVGGGVSANAHLQQTFKKILRKESPHTAINFPSKNLTTDNALMIAIAGYFQYQKKKPAKNQKLLKASGNLAL